MNQPAVSPRKVLHVLNGAGGGAALSTIGLIEALRARGVESCAVSHSAGRPSERELLVEATRGECAFMPLYLWNRKIRARLWKRPLFEMRQILVTGWARRSAARVAEFATRHGADLIHTNTILTPEGGLAARQLQLPHVWHLRELVGPGKPFRLPLEGPPLGRYLAEHCSKLVANSNVTAAQVRDWLPAGLLEVVPNGIDISRFVPRDADNRQGPIVVAMVGSMNSRWKKHALFVEAAARVDPSLPIQWRIYGHDPSQGGTVRGDEYVDALHDRIRRHELQDRFHWPGFHADPARIMAEIDILLHPADDESFGRVVVEAMAAGLPVVGVSGGGVGEIVADGVTGLLARPDDAAGLAAAVQRLVQHPELRREMGIAGRRRAESHYSIEACVAGILEVYRLAIARPLGRRAAVAP